MKIKTQTGQQRKPRSRFGNWLFRLGTVFGLLVLVLASMEYGRQLASDHQFIPFQSILGNVLESRWEIASRFLKGRFSKPDHIYIDVKYKHWQKILFQRDQAIRSGKLVTRSDDDFVPVKIRHHHRQMPAKIRLKGDNIEHLANTKWSFRIKLGKEHSLYGMRVFSIQHPSTRNYLHEWVYHRILSEEGVMAPRYRFVNVHLNGKNLGIYALEEHFQKHLVESHGNIESPILKFDESVFWENHVSGMIETGLWEEGASTLDAFGMKRIQKNPVLNERFLLGRNLLEAFRRGELPAHKAFNARKMAVFLVLSDLMGATHALFWENLRFYYNPVDSLLEPVGFDGNAGMFSEKKVLLGAQYHELNKGDQSFYSLLFEDPLFFEAYLSEVERISRPEFLNAFFVKIAAELEEKRAILDKEFYYIHFSAKIYHQQREKIRKTLQPARLLYAHLKKISPDAVVVTVGNIQRLPVEALFLSDKKSNKFYPVSRVVLAGRRPMAQGGFQDIRFERPPDPGPDGRDAKDWMLHARVLGMPMDHKMEISIFPWEHLNPQLLESDGRRKTPNVRDFSFLRVREESRVIEIMPGRWRIQKNMVIPEGYTFVVFPGTQMDLKRSAKIISYSPLRWEGEEGRPIRVYSSDGTGQGLAVFRALRPSTLQHVVFSGLKHPREPGWQLTGSVTFYDSPVNILHARFHDLEAEDGINIKNSDFSIRHSLFSGMKSDGIDTDFSNGEITDSSFEKIGGDAVDTSGSTVTLRDILVRGARDKGVSVGEKSVVGIDGLRVENSDICLAVKDLSEVHLKKGDFFDCRVGLAVFQKKPEFGPASVVTGRIGMKMVPTPFLVEENSSCLVEGEIIRPNDGKLTEALYRK